MLRFVVSYSLKAYVVAVLRPEASKSPKAQLRRFGEDATICVFLDEDEYRQSP